MNNVQLFQGEGIDAIYFDTMYFKTEISRNAASLLPAFWVNSNNSIDLRLENPFDVVNCNFGAVSIIDDTGRTINYGADGQIYIGTVPVSVPVIVTPLYIFDNSDSLRISKRSLYPDTISCPPVVVPLPSLNGNGCEYLDGDSVTVLGRDTVYSVKRSYMGLVADNSYTALYDLQSIDGAKCSAPENLLVRYVAPVVTTP